MSSPVSSGTFQWSFFWIDCSNNNHFFALVNATYTIVNVQVGPINYNVLTMTGPQTPVTLLGAANNSCSQMTSYTFQLSNFTPAVPMVGPSVNVPLSIGNVNAIQISGGCMQSGACIEQSYHGQLQNTISGYVPQFQAQVAVTGTNFVNTTLTNQTFTLSQPWVFVVPSY